MLADRTESTSTVPLATCVTMWAVSYHWMRVTNRRCCFQPAVAWSLFLWPPVCVYAWDCGVWPQPWYEVPFASRRNIMATLLLGTGAIWVWNKSKCVCVCDITNDVTNAVGATAPA